jgi:AcrR family transcriptional regulator
MDETRDRIASAAFELHREVGPAYASISAIAERAGVERHTVYRHFPDLVRLLRACTEHGMRITGLPEPTPWLAIADPFERLRHALREMYRYYRSNEQLIANILRDLPVMPDLALGSQAYQDHMGLVWQTALSPWQRLRGARGERIRAVAATALEFGTWQGLARRNGLTDDAAADTMVAAVRGLVESDLSLASGRATPPRERHRSSVTSRSGRTFRHRRPTRGVPAR